MDRILIVHNKYQIKGGEDTVVENEVRMLKSRGHFVYEYIRNNSEINSFSLKEKILLPFRTIYNHKTYKEIIDIIKENTISIVHVHNTHMLISPSVLYAAKKMNIPVVTTLHNFRMLCVNALLYRNDTVCEKCVCGKLYPGFLNKCYRNSLSQSLILTISNLIHRITNIYTYCSYICLSDFNKTKLLSLKKIDPSKVFVKPNFTNVSSNIYSGNNHNNKDYYLFLGRLDKSKGIDLIIHAFSHMPSKKLIVAGTGPLYEDCLAFVEKEHITNIELLGFCGKEKVNELLSNAKCLVCASQWYEGHPMTVVEAFAHGLPAIVGDLGNMGLIVSDNYNGIKYDYTSYEALISAVDRFEKLDYNSISSNAYNTYLEKYTEDKNYEILMNIYNRIKS